jgi:glycosyl transferase family 2
MANLAPIVLFIYNRPEHTRRTLAALAANPLAAESDLIIYADGPKGAEHAASVAQARAVAGNATGFRSVKLIERDKNWGLANSIIAGISEVCAANGRVIVVEDDLLVAPGFLAFMNSGLDRYAEDDRVLQVSGFMFPGIGDRLQACFLPLTTTWGWATWRRAWNLFDPSLSKLELLEQDSILRRRFDLNGSYAYFEMAKQQQQGTVDSWGIRWYMTVFFRGGLVLYPGRSLVTNIGADGSGTHGVVHPRIQASSGSDGEAASFILPHVVEGDLDRMQDIEKLLRSTKRTLFGGVVNWLRR